MADSEPISKVSASASITGMVTIINSLIDGRNKFNRTDLVDGDITLGVTGSEGIIYAEGATATCDIDLPASADAPGLLVLVYVKDDTFAVTIVRDGADTINGAGADPTPAINTGRALISLGDGDWLMWSIP